MHCYSSLVLRQSNLARYARPRLTVIPICGNQCLTDRTLCARHRRMETDGFLTKLPRLSSGRSRLSTIPVCFPHCLRETWDQREILVTVGVYHRTESGFTADPKSRRR